jgi:hypothetical protein
LGRLLNNIFAYGTVKAQINAHILRYIGKAFSLYSCFMKSRQFQNFSRAKQKRSRFGVDFARLFEKSGSLEPHKANNHRVSSALFYVRV